MPCRLARKLIAPFPAFVVQNCNSSWCCEEPHTVVRGELCERTLRSELWRTSVCHGGSSWGKEPLPAGRNRQEVGLCKWSCSELWCCWGPGATPITLRDVRQQHRVLEVLEGVTVPIGLPPPAPQNPLTLTRQSLVLPTLCPPGPPPEHFAPWLFIQTTRSIPDQFISTQDRLWSL